MSERVTPTRAWCVLGCRSWARLRR